MSRSVAISMRSLVRSGVVLGLVGAAAFGVLDGVGSVDAQSTTGTPTPTASSSTSTANSSSATATQTPAASTASTTTTSGSAAFTANQAVVVNVDKLNLRADSSINATVDAQLLDGTWATIVSGPVDPGDGHAWYHINVNDATGWVDGAYLADAAGAASTMPVGVTVVVATDSVNFRSAPSLTGTIESKLANGNTGTVVGAAQTAAGFTWLQLDVNGVTGWAAREFLAFAPSDISTVATGGSALVNTDVLVLRDSPATTGTKLADLAGGTTVTVVSGPTAGNDGDWYQVSDGATTGWVSADYLRVV